MHHHCAIELKTFKRQTLSYMLYLKDTELFNTFSERSISREPKKVEITWSKKTISKPEA